MFVMVVDWSAVSSHPTLRERRLNALRAWDGTFARRVSLEMPLLHRWARSLDRGSAEGFAPLTIRSTRNPRARIVSTETSPVDVLREHNVNVRWNAPATAAKPVETRGKHVAVSLDRDALRRAETFTLCEGATGSRDDRGLGFRTTESRYIVVARQRDVTLIEWGTSAAMRLSSDEQRSTLRAGQRAPESVRGKLCVQARGQRGRLPERDSPLWGDGEWVRQTAAIRDAHTAVETARFALDCAVSEHSNALDDVSVGAVTAAMVRSAERAAERARLSLDNALDALARCEGAYLATMAEQIRDSIDANASTVSVDVSHKSEPVRRAEKRGKTAKHVAVNVSKAHASPRPLPQPTVEPVPQEPTVEPAAPQPTRRVRFVTL